MITTKINAIEYNITNLFVKNKKELLSCFDFNSNYNHIRDLTIEFFDCAVCISTLETDYIDTLSSSEINLLIEKTSLIFTDFILNNNEKKVFFIISQNPNDRGLNLLISFTYLEAFL